MEDVLAHHHRVVHHDPERDDEAKEREHVDGGPHGRQQDEGSEDRDRDADRGPERDAELQQEAEGQEHEEQAHGAVEHQELEALLVVDRAVPRQRQADRVREVRARSSR